MSIKFITTKNRSEIYDVISLIKEKGLWRVFCVLFKYASEREQRLFSYRLNSGEDSCLDYFCSFTDLNNFYIEIQEESEDVCIKYFTPIITISELYYKNINGEYVLDEVCGSLLMNIAHYEDYKKIITCIQDIIKNIY